MYVFVQAKYRERYNIQGRREIVSRTCLKGSAADLCGGHTHLPESSSAIKKEKKCLNKYMLSTQC